MSLNETVEVIGCSAIDEARLEKPVRLRGWVRKLRDLGGVVFLDLRDRSGIVQVVAEPGRSPDEAVAVARELRLEDVVEIQGRVMRRQQGMENREMATGAFEVLAEAVTVLNRADTPPFPVEDDCGASEELRLRYRYLDLRRPAMSRNLELRHRTMMRTRAALDAEGFIEVETPMLTKSTPEGARDFLVPSRVHRGDFYALPQSPQLFKQLLMVAGVGRYFQIARCFRDEDLRADRQPEFTQIDLEMSFIDEEDVYRVIERLFQAIFPPAGIDCPDTFPRLTWQQAMDRYGSDRPDTRFGLELFDVTDVASTSGFQVFAGADQRQLQVKGLTLPGGASFSRKQIDELTELAKRHGAGGLVWLRRRDGEIASSARKHLEDEVAATILERGQAADGDLVLLAVDRPPVVANVLGNLRLHLGRSQDLIPEGRHDFLWVTDFPLLEWDDETSRWYACHHPFTSPRDQDLDRLESDPGSVRARAYDVVLDGLELGGGSIRIHRSDVQSRMFRALGIDEEEAKSKFGFLLDAFRFGAPPHGGIALGFDRICMLLAGAGSLREVIAFPKTTSASCLMTEAPSEVDDPTLRDLGLSVSRRSQPGGDGA